MSATLADFLNQPLNDIITKNPDVAALYKALVIHSVNEAQSKHKYFVEFSPIHCDDEGNCLIRINYR